MDAVRFADIYRLDATTSANPSTPIPIYLISAHLKAGTAGASGDDISDEANRSLGAKDIMDYINNTDNVIVVGDLNLQDETEQAYTDFMSNPTYTEQLTDPLGAWTRDNASPSNVAKYTQSTRTTSNALSNGGAGGGICDRFDFILYNDEIALGTNGIAYLPNTMTTIGNQGLNVNQSILTGTSPIKQELYNFSDHYPVVADFQLDATNVIIQDCQPYAITTNCTTTTENFTNYSGQGFVTLPAPGQLCSNAWDFDGFDEPYQFGFDNFGDFALGATNGGVGQGGIYDNQGALWIQPTSTTFTPGSVVLKACNQTNSNILTLDIAYDQLILNDNNRSNRIQFAYSTDSITFTTLPALTLTSIAPENDQLDTIPQAATINNLNIAPNQCLYLRWSGNDVSGSGSRDEFGIDNISICATATTCPDSLALNDTPIAAATYQAQKISSTGTIPTNTTVTLQAEQTIRLLDGFQAQGNLTATIAPCTAPLNNNHVNKLLASQPKTSTINQAQPTQPAINIHPNPTNGQSTITIQLTEPQHLQIRLITPQGQLLQQIAQKKYPSGKHQLTIGQQTTLPKGIYYIQIHGNQTSTHTLIKL